MRRLATTVLLAVVASALTGALPPTGASGRSSPPPPPRAVVASVAARFSVEREIEQVPVARRASRSGDGERSTDAVWAALAACESSGNDRAVGGGGRYFGAFQFSIATWRSLGLTGNPADHPYAVQLDAAKRLQARRGWSQWPACARRLGLR